MVTCEWSYFEVSRWHLCLFAITRQVPLFLLPLVTPGFASCFRSVDAPSGAAPSPIFRLFLLWAQNPKISFLRFRLGCLLIMKNFSNKQSWHIFLLFTVGWLCPMLFHDTLKSIFLSFKSHTCSLNLVSVLCCCSLNEDLWALNLVLNEFWVRPMYVSFLPVSDCVTVAS